MSEIISNVCLLNARPGKEAETRAVLLALTAATRQEPGCVCYRLHERTNLPGKFVIYEQWRNQAALDFHMAQKHLLDFLTRENELLSEPVKGHLCTEL